MLVLTRSEGEALRIGDDIILTVASAGNAQVKIGIEAPRHVEVVRSELRENTTPPNTPNNPQHQP